MKTIKKLLKILLLIFFISCTTEYIVKIDEFSTNSLFIYSNIDSAIVFINKKITNYKTPCIIKDIYYDSINIALFYPGINNFQDTTIYFKDKKTKSIFYEIKLTNDTVSLNIQSAPNNADCIINGYNFGNTPLYIKGLQKNKYTILLQKGNYKKLISIKATNNITIFDSLIIEHKPLIEHFLNVSCAGCKEADEIINLYQQYNTIAYNTNYPEKNDPLYLYNPTQINQRLQHYLPRSLPAIYIDGQIVNYKELSNLEQIMNSMLEKQKQVNTNISLEFVNTAISNDSLYGTMLAENANNTTLNIVLVEQTVEFPESPGNNGMKTFYNVFRNQQTVNIKDNIQKVNFSFNIKNLPTRSFKIIAYVEQNKNILQTNSIIP